MVVISTIGIKSCSELVFIACNIHDERKYHGMRVEVIMLRVACIYEPLLNTAGLREPVVVTY